jgi:TolB-like protein/DNA-binding winged helix-turn-helix (wHTH) protein/Tfp pilus assembly protein PilF
MAVMSKPKTSFFEFGPFRLDTVRRLLLRDETVVALPPKAFDTLLALVENCDRVLEKSELMAAVWPDSFVEESNLTQTVSILRRALGERASEHRYIVTVPGRGYRFVASLGQPAAPVADSILDSNQIVAQQQQSTNNGQGAQVEPHPTQEKLGLSKQQPADRWKLRANPLSLRTRKPAGWGDTLVIVLAVIALVAIALWAYRYIISFSESRTAPIRSIAVLPLKNLTGDPAQDYYSEGMTESLITALSKVEGLTVIWYNSVSRFKGQDADPREVGKLFGVAAVLEGSVRKSNDSVRVVVRLVSIEDGQVLWTRDTHERAPGDIFALQDEIARTVVAGLRLKLGHKGEQQLAKRYTENVEAYEAYMQGRSFWNKRTGEGFRKAIAHFEQAIDIDPNYALAYAGLADCYLMMSPYALLGVKESFAKTKAAALQALALDNQLAEAHTSLAHITFLYDWNFPAAEAEFLQALELDENYPTAHQWYAVYLSSMGRHDEAIAQAKRARELDPTSLPIIQDMARAYYHARRYDEAIATSLKALEIDPQYHRVNSWLELAYAQKGLYREAVEERLKAMSLVRVDPAMIALRKNAYTTLGWRGYWQKELELLLRRPQPGAQYQLVRIYMRLGQKEQALRLLEEAYKERLDHLVLLKADPILDPLRDDARFTDLLRRVGLVPR